MNRMMPDRRAKWLIGLSLVPLSLVCGFLFLRGCGLLRPFSVSSGAMAPTVSAGDFVMMEGFTYRMREPRRGELVVFRTDGIDRLPPGSQFIKRVAGLPGEHVRIAEGKLFVNGKEMPLRNGSGRIEYLVPQPLPGWNVVADGIVPRGCYFVLGDNSANSLDSRYWGSVPRENIMGRVSFRFLPPGRVGRTE